MSSETTPQAPGEITGQVMFYSRPEPLTPQAHGKLRLKMMEAPFAFAAAAHIVPVQVTEFGPASASYPLIFAGSAKTPMAILGLRAGENLFVNSSGRYEDYAYIPGFIRRYPFVLAGQQDQGQLIVCIDRDAPMVGEEGETALFENGQLTPAAQNAVNFCSDFETERRRTEQFVARLTELDLFEPKAATFTPRNPDGSTGQPFQLADYFAISEEKLNALPDATLRELQTTGALRQIHAHLISAMNWEKMIGRAAARGAQATATATVN